MQRLLGLSFLVLCGSLLAAGGTDPNDQSGRIPTRIRGKPKAPEFADIFDWVNTQPITMAEFKGKVVMVHFMAVDSTFCAHNYPFYKSVWKDLKDKGVVVIGIHTPETEAERDVKHVKKKVEDAGLTFPIAIDNKSTMWVHYFNDIWPSVYLIDKEGKARYVWHGELSTKGAKGEVHLRRLIGELLKE
jgi:peroxiredoxin